MNSFKEEFSVEDILTGLYKLASVGCAKAFDVDLAAMEELSGERVSPETLTALAMLGAINDEELEFVEVCRSVLVKDNTNEEEEIIDD